MASPLRRAAVAGSWYPGRPDALTREIEGYLAGVAPQSVPGRLVGLVSPHAGFRYSGPVAAHGYSLLKGLHDLTVVLVGPSHRVAFDGVAVYARGAFETPLGTIPIDDEVAGALLEDEDELLDDPRPHRDEHSLEMQLPFIQYFVRGLKIVPCLMGTQGRLEVEKLSAALGRVLAGRRAVLVASSDLSHYHPAPVANERDALVVADVSRFDDAGLMKRLERSWDCACGGGAIVAVMKAARALGADTATVLRYADSGDAGEHDKSRVVGYLSAALSAASA
jgi:hypothetical protein